MTIAAAGNNGDRDTNTDGLQVNEGDTITVTVTAHGRMAGVIQIEIGLSGDATAGVTNAFDVRFTSLAAIVGFREIEFEETLFSVVDDSDAESNEDITFTLDRSTLIAAGGANPATWTVGTPSSVTVTILANDGYVPPPPVPDDDPVAREMRVEAPAATVARGVGQLAAGAVVGRLTASVAGGNTFNLGRAATAEELLRAGSFSLAGNNGSRGFNFWGGGSYVSADGEHDGVTYDGDTTAFHVGIDTHWRDGLIGVAVGTSDGDTDFTVTADGMKSKLETDVTSVHPYLTRRLNNSQLWLTAGHGSGDAELKEPGTVIKTDVTVTTAAFGITHARGDVFTGGLSALYSRAKLDAATGDNKTLPATTADGLRITADAEVGKRIGNLRPFALFAFRHDSGDGDTGGAADLGGGLEYRTPTVLVRLEGSGHIQGQGADESRVSLTARKSSGNFNLGLNLGADESGIDTARLLYGEWRF